MKKTLAYFDLEPATHSRFALDALERRMTELLLESALDTYLSDNVEEEPEKPVIRGDIED